MKIGVLALQGAFLEHEKILSKLGVETVEIRKKSDLENNIFDGIVLPGGESTAMGKLLHDLDLFLDIKKIIESGIPTFGTCAGMILLAKKIENDDKVHFGVMDITVMRNAYGRQLGSFFTENDFKNIGVVPMTFIRAPYITSISDDVEILSVVENKIVAAKQNNILVTSYHPELNNDLRVHEYFVNMCREYKNN